MKNKREDHSFDITNMDGKNANRKITAEIEKEIKEKFSRGFDLTKLSEEYKVSPNTIRYHVDPTYNAQVKQWEQIRQKKHGSRRRAEFVKRYQTDEEFRARKLAINRKSNSRPEAKAMKRARDRELRAEFTPEMWRLLGNGDIQCICNESNCWHNGPCPATDSKILCRDHYQGGGRMDRRKNQLTGYEIRKLVMNPWFTINKFQALCANCNMKKMFNNGER